MCGIAGIISPHKSFVNLASLKQMADSLRHRGPDGEGFWINPENNVGFGHRRLSILDITEAGSQPMHYMDRYTIVFNGEIYNYIELRKELQKAGYSFYSTGDTEVILAAYDMYKSRCLQYFDGMFAFAIWDQKEQKLFAARDRFGEKPFYYFSDNNRFVFGSEMKALWAMGIDKTIDEKMMLNFLALGYVQNPSDKSLTFYKNITSLKPSHYIIVDGLTAEVEMFSYWDINKQVSQKYSIAQALHKFDHIFSASIHKRLRSDVPVGASLSGGLDSSAITWYIQRQLNKKNNGVSLKTFSAVFPGFEKDESRFINTISKDLHIENFKVSPGPHDLLNDIEKLAWHQEEPFPSSSIFAQYKVFELAKSKGVRVLLDGQGADESLAGYHKYMHWFLQEFVSRSRFIKARKERHLLMENKVDLKWGVKNVLAAYLPSHAAIALEKGEYKRILHNPFISEDLIGTLRGREWEGIHKPIITKLNDILYFNTMCIGLEELLRFSDRSSMANSTEVRLPFLNAELVQFIFSLPSAYKIHDGFPKWILRKLMQDRLPASIVWRTDKTGYEPPQKSWMEDESIKDYIHESKRILVKNGILKNSVLENKIQAKDAHKADNFDWRYLCIAQMMSMRNS